MKVIIDSNVFVSALATRTGLPNKIYNAWRNAQFDIVTSEYQIDELKRISRYPKIKELVPSYIFGALIRNMRHRNTVVLPVIPEPEDIPKYLFIKDSDDFFLLTMAWVSEADYLVTGDKKSGILDLGRIKNTVVLTTSDFCNTCLND